MRSPRSRAFLLVASILVLAALFPMLGCDDEFTQPCIGCGPWIPPQIISPGALIAALSLAYQTRNYAWFAACLSTAEDGAAYVYTFGDSLGGEWDVEQEICCHRRMFNPENPLPGETPVPPQLWLQSIDIHLVPTSEWSERPDLYRSTTNPNGLDPERWKASGAEYRADVLFATQGETDYRVADRADFVVLEDRAKPMGSERKFLLYRWSGSVVWSSVRRLYACAPSPAPRLDAGR